MLPKLSPTSDVLERPEHGLSHAEYWTVLDAVVRASSSEMSSPWYVGKAPSVVLKIGKPIGVISASWLAISDASAENRLGFFPNRAWSALESEVCSAGWSLHENTNGKEPAAVPRGESSIMCRAFVNVIV